MIWLEELITNTSCLFLVFSFGWWKSASKTSLALWATELTWLELHIVLTIYLWQIPTKLSNNSNFILMPKTEIRRSFRMSHCSRYLTFITKYVLGLMTTTTSQAFLSYRIILFMGANSNLSSNPSKTSFALWLTELGWLQLHIEYSSSLWEHTPDNHLQGTEV